MPTKATQTADIAAADPAGFPPALRRQFRDLLFGSAPESELENLAEADFERLSALAFQTFAVRMPDSHNVHVGAGEGDVGHRHMPVILATDDDDAGERYAAAIARTLTARGVDLRRWRTDART